MNDPEKTAAVPPPDEGKKDSQGRIGTILAGRYRILKLLGEGAQGSVYVGEHVKIGRKDAIKVLQPELMEDVDAVARFTRGASKASHINHPNVCTVYDFGETEDGLPFMASELVDGKELHDVMKREKPMALERAVDLIEQAAAGLHAAHQLNVVHRDLKPANIMLTKSREGRDVVKVVDFDIAKGIGESDSAGGGLTQAGWIIGTPQYMSPEQITAAEIDARSDIYSLALIFFEMVTGDLPNDTSSTQKLMWQRVSGDLRTLAEVCPQGDFPPALQAALDHALAKDPENRPATAVEFAREIREAVEAPGPAPAAEDADATSVLEAPTVAVPEPKIARTRAGTPPAPGQAAVPATEAAPNGVPATEAAPPPTTAEEPGSRRERSSPSSALSLGPALAGVAGLGIAGLALAWGTGMIGGGASPTLTVPAALELEVGDQRVLEAGLVDADGAPVAGASLGFSSRNRGVVVVDEFGQLLATAPGSTWVLVRAGDVMDSVPVTVLPEGTRTAASPGEGDAAEAAERVGGDEPAAPPPSTERSDAGGTADRAAAEARRETPTQPPAASTPSRDPAEVRRDLVLMTVDLLETTPAERIRTIRRESLTALEDPSLPRETLALANWVHAQALDLLGEAPSTWCSFAREAVRLDPEDEAYRQYVKDDCRLPESP